MKFLLTSAGIKNDAEMRPQLRGQPLELRRNVVLPATPSAIENDGRGLCKLLEHEHVGRPFAPALVVLRGTRHCCRQNGVERLE
jgi:hypothetical protein